MAERKAKDRARECGGELFVLVDRSGGSTRCSARLGRTHRIMLGAHSLTVTLDELRRIRAAIDAVLPPAPPAPPAA